MIHSNHHALSLRWLYTKHHACRFEWIRAKIPSLGKENLSIIELGCNDARSLTYIPVSVTRYLGFDAGWQSGWKDGTPFGFEAARTCLLNDPAVEVRKSTSPRDIESLDEQFDLALVMETFEYLEPASLDSYVAAIARKVRPDGCLLSTMPNEKGLPLLVKALGSKISGVPRSQYTARQFCDAVLGRMDRVPRAPRGRKGFDYALIARLLERHFPFVRLESVGLVNLPLHLSSNIGIVASRVPVPARPEVPSSSAAV